MQKFILLLSCLALSYSFLSQNHIFYVNQRFGVATNQGMLPRVNNTNTVHFQEGLANKNFRFRYDIGTLFGYEYKLIKSTNTYIFTAFESAKSKYDLKIHDWTLDNIDVMTRRNAFQLGVRQRFSFWEERLQLGLGLGLVKRFYPEDTRVYIHEAELITETNIYNWEFKFTTLNDGQHWQSGFRSNREITNFELDVFSAFKVNDYLNIRFSFMYNRNHHTNYLLGFRGRDIDLVQGVTFFKEYEGYIGINGAKHYTLHHNFYTSLGLEINIDKVFRKLKTTD